MLTNSWFPTFTNLNHGELITPLDNATIKARITELTIPTNQALIDNLKSHIPYIEEVTNYIIFSGGKRLRPILFILAANAAGGSDKSILNKFSSIFEYLHAATLLHDDVVDEAGLRRGRPAARVKYGNAPVVLVGDFLFSKSYSLAAEIPDQRFITTLTDCTTHIAEGQILELIHTDDLELKAEKYLQIIIAKTAVLLAAACQMGALLAKADDITINSLYKYGMELGIAFQMVDDALDYVGTEHEFGKPVGHDLAEGKITFPFIYARDQAEPKLRAHLLRLVKKGERKTNINMLNEAKQIVRNLGGIEATYAEAKGHAFQAQQALQSILTKKNDFSHDYPYFNDLKILLSLPHYILTRRS